jgi:hypothetical protein
MSLAVRLDLSSITVWRRIAASTWSLAGAALTLVSWKIGSGPSLLVPEPLLPRLGLAMRQALGCIWVASVNGRRVTTVCCRSTPPALPAGGRMAAR